MLSFMQAPGNEEEERTGCGSEAEAQKVRRSFVICGEAGHKRVSSQVCSFNTHKSSQELGKPVMAAQGGAAHVLAFDLVHPTTSGRSALLLSVCFLPLAFLPLPCPQSFLSGWQ